MSGPHQVRSDPSYPFCEFCETESDNDAGWHEACRSFVHEHDLKPVPEPRGTVGEIIERFSWTVVRDVDPETGNPRIAA